MNTKIITAKHPNGMSLVYDDEAHTYTDETGRTYTSVTRFVGNFFPKFDAPTVAAKIARRENTTAETIQLEWTEKRNRLGREGHNVHAYADALMSGRKTWKSAANVREAQLYRQATIAIVALLKKFEYIGSEVIIFSPTFGLAGTVDLIMRDRKTKAIVIFDWKQNLKIKTDNFWSNALEPIDHLADCNWSKYQLQLGLYYKIIKTENYFNAPTYRAALVHLGEDQYRVFKLKNSMNTEITRMMAHKGE